MTNLDTTYLDLYLIHFPVAVQAGNGLLPTDSDGKVRFDNDVDFVDTWRELERAVDDGLVRSIGVSNFNRAQCKRLLAACRIRPVINQVECHPYLGQHKLSEFLRGEQIVLTAYSPLGSPDRPNATADRLMDEVSLKGVAERYGKSTAQILIRYQVERGHVVIPKSVTSSRIESNRDVFDFRLDEDDMRVIGALERNKRLLEFEL